MRDDTLRTRILDEAVALVAGGGTGALTTRAVAAAAETSLPAIHELFGGKAGLARAISAEGFTRLHAALAAVPTTGDARHDVLDAALAFRDFATRNPHLFEVMFSRPIAELGPTPEEQQSAAGVHRAVTERVDALLGRSAPPAERKDAAIGLFGLVRGLAELELAGILGSGPASVERRWRTSVAAFVRGLASAAAEDAP